METVTHGEVLARFGLALSDLFGWSWADPVAALIIGGVAVKEGREAWRGDTCCTPLPPAAAAACGTDGCQDGCCAAER